MRLVLGRDADAADAGIDRVGQREIDDPGLAAEIDRGLGAAIGQFLQAAAASAGQHIGHGVARQRLGSLSSSPCCSPPRFTQSSNMLQHDRRQRRQQDRRRSVAPRSRATRLDRTAIALAAAAIIVGIGVEHFAPRPATGSGTRNASRTTGVILADHGNRLARPAPCAARRTPNCWHHRRSATQIPSSSQSRACSAGLVAIEPVQIAHQPAHALMRPDNRAGPSRARAPRSIRAAARTPAP